MAGAGYRSFSAGAVLTAAQVNTFLMEQSVMNFAGTAARGSALASVLSAGQMAHVGGGTVTVYDGSAWQQVYPSATSAGLVFVAGTAFSAVSSVSVNNCFQSSYLNYQLLINVDSVSVANSLNLRLRASGVDNSSNNYYYNGTRTDTAAGALNALAPGLVDIFRIFVSNSGTGSARIDMYNPQASVRTAVSYQSISQNATDITTIAASGMMSVTTSYDGFTLLASTGNITGTVRVYGYRNS